MIHLSRFHPRSFARSLCFSWAIPTMRLNRFLGASFLYISLFLIFLLAVPFPASQPETRLAGEPSRLSFAQMPLFFIENRGQLNEQVAFYVQGSDKTLYFTSEGVTYLLNNSVSAPALTQNEGAKNSRWVVKLDFVGANIVQPVGLERTDAIISYFKGNQTEWRTGIPTYSQVIYPDLWDGIELRFQAGVHQLKVDASGNAYITGETSSDEASFPVTIGPDLSFNGEKDAFVAKVNSTGNALLYAGYIGGSDSDDGRGISVGPDLTHNGGIDAFVAKINPAGTSLIYAGYIGGSSWESSGYQIAVDTLGFAYVTVGTESLDFPVKVGPDLVKKANSDVFVSKIKSDGSGLVYSGFIGGALDEGGSGIAVDSGGNAYVTGDTYSNGVTFPVINGPNLYHSGDRDAFVSMVKSDGTALLYSGYIGGSKGDIGSQIAVDSSGNAYVTGYTDSTQASFAEKVGPDLSYNGGDDAFVAKISSISLIVEVQVPTGDSQPYGIAADEVNNVWFTEAAGNNIARLSSPQSGAFLPASWETTTSSITEYPIPTTNSAPSDIVLGPDGNMWFTEYYGNKIGKITPAGVITEYSLPNANSAPIAITVGPDGNLWFCEETGNRIGKMSTAGVLLNEYTVPTAGSELNDIVAGPDGNLWFTEYSGMKVGKITTSGVITEYDVGAKAYGITAGEDGNLWFTETYADRIGRITPTGDLTHFDLSGGPHGPLGILAVPQQGLWVVANFSNKILRLVYSGVVLSAYDIPTSSSSPQALALTSDGTVYFTEMDGNKIGSVIAQGGNLYLPLIKK